ncbi:GNAT family N-acetyltransferase [Cellulomonas cellasea]|uniref:Putative acetyltransferase n=1 Tax=Cellulomonas cellasea TaxID=43670 RepID=A0A7W4YAN1_9CELL|nr:GNAT family N-acetyltransferase [Cellulomonas cellasea]MBB2921611.1 putative acetyltransferase [Cellulomonas cellasea]
MDLRPYRDDDAAATLDVFRRAIRVLASRDYTAEQVAAWASPDIDPTGWAARRSASRTQVAEVDGRVVGFTDVDNTGYVDMLFVDPDVARRGTASALLRWVRATAAELGLRELTTNASLTARPVFEAHGFAVVAEQHPVLDGVELTNFRMRCVLDPAAGMASDAG